MKGRCTWCWGTTDEAYCCAGCQHDHNEGRTPPWDARAKAALAAEREAHAAIERNDARHARDIAAVRKRAEAAERERNGYVAGYETELAVHAETRAEIARLRAALEEALGAWARLDPGGLDHDRRASIKLEGGAS